MELREGQGLVKSSVREGQVWGCSDNSTVLPCSEEAGSPVKTEAQLLCTQPPDTHGPSHAHCHSTPVIICLSSQISCSLSLPSLTLPKEERHILDGCPQPPTLPPIPRHFLFLNHQCLWDDGKSALGRNGPPQRFS